MIRDCDVKIIQAGSLPQPARTAFGDYPELVKHALGVGFRCRTVDARTETLPGTLARGAKAFVITGSEHSVYDDLPWIGELMHWLRAREPEVPVVGICFGHQIAAHALGGCVARALQGPQVGHSVYDLSGPWQGSNGAVTCLASYHYDQVAKPPEGTQIIAASQACPIAGLHYPGRRLLTLQAHPEFLPELMPHLIDDWHLTGIIDAGQKELAMRTLTMPATVEPTLRLIRDFLEGRC